MPSDGSVSSDRCYRHPDRQSFVLCQRCGRTICGECQTPGAVGVICPECMREQRATAPRPRRFSLLRSDTTPVVTYTLMAVTAGIFVLQQIPGLGVTGWLAYAGVYSTADVLQPWRLLTAVFLHGGILHLLLNMYTLFIFGQLLEGSLGRARFLALYLLSGLAGSVGVLYLSNPLSPVVGASGAIFGLMGAFLVIQRRLGGPTTQLLILVGINLVIGFVPGFNISWQAHVGGLVGGALVGLVLTSTRRARKPGLEVTLLSALAVLLVVLGVLPALAG